MKIRKTQDANDLIINVRSGQERQIPVFPLNPSKCPKDSELDEITTENRDKNGPSDYLSDSLYGLARELSERKKMYFTPIPYAHYRECKLSEGKEWFVFFYVQDPETSKLRRIRIKLNRIKSIAERRKTARSMMAAINQRLALGWNPLLERSAPRGGTKLSEALDAFLKIKEKEMEPTSLRMYKSFVKTFRTWIAGHGIPDGALAMTFNKASAREFLDEVELNYTAKTYNNYLGFFRSLFGWMLTKGYIAENPFADFVKKSKRLTKKQRRILTDTELSRLVSFLEKENPQYLAACLICYSCFIRPKEIVLLHCRDIDLKRQVIHVDASIAKNDNESYRTIPDHVVPFLQKLDLSVPSHYVFGGSRCNLFRPSAEQVCSRELARYWNLTVRPACKFGMDVQFYSLKDTGITNMLGGGVPINLVQQQADHSSVAMTAIYVGKSAGASEELKKVNIMK